MYTCSKVLIADDHPLFRAAMKQAVSQALGDIDVVTSDSFSKLQKAIEQNGDADLVLLDLHMPGSAGFSALRYLGLSCPHIPVVIVSAHEDVEIVHKAIEHGAAGFIAKSATLDDIVHSVRQVLSGDTVMPEGVDLSNPNRDSESQKFNQRIESLTPRQFRVLMMLIDGKTNRELADEICVTEATIKAHLTEIFRKLEVSNRTQAARLASVHLEVEEPSFSVST